MKNLRKVKITKYEDGSGGYTTNAYFHEFGNATTYSEQNGTYPVKLP